MYHLDKYGDRPLEGCPTIKTNKTSRQNAGSLNIRDSGKLFHYHCGQLMYSKAAMYV